MGFRRLLVAACAVLLLTAACGQAEQIASQPTGNATATFEAAKASLLQERRANATQTAAHRPTSTPVPPTATPTVTPTPSPTPSPTASPTPLTEPVAVVTEDFADTVDLPFWTGADGLYTADVVDGAFDVSILGKGAKFIDLNGLEDLGDAVIQVDVRFEGAGSAGIFARLAGENGNRDDRGYYCALRYTGTLWCHNGVAGQWECLCSLNAHFLAFEGVNTLQVAIVGETIQISLNGVVLHSVTDTSSSFGAWGLFAQNHEDGQFRAWFDNVVITKLPPGYQLEQGPETS